MWFPLAEIGRRLSRKMLKDIACRAKPDTILAWYRRLRAQKLDGSKLRSYPGRPGEARARHGKTPLLPIWQFSPGLISSPLNLTWQGWPRTMPYSSFVWRGGV